jgi:hypothetical protein
VGGMTRIRQLCGHCEALEVSITVEGVGVEMAEAEMAVVTSVSLDMAGVEMTLAAPSPTVMVTIAISVTVSTSVTSARRLTLWARACPWIPKPLARNSMANMTAEINEIRKSEERILSEALWNLRFECARCGLCGLLPRCLSGVWT